MSLPVAVKTAKTNLMNSEEFKSAVVAPPKLENNDELNDSRLSQLFSNDEDRLLTFTQSHLTQDLEKDVGAVFLPLQIVQKDV